MGGEEDAERDVAAERHRRISGAGMVWRRPEAALLDARQIDTPSRLCTERRADDCSARPVEDRGPRPGPDLAVGQDAGVRLNLGDLRLGQIAEDAIGLDPVEELLEPRDAWPFVTVFEDVHEPSVHGGPSPDRQGWFWSNDASSPLESTARCALPVLSARGGVPLAREAVHE